jgi:hypothetical protein
MRNGDSEALVMAPIIIIIIVISMAAMFPSRGSADDQLIKLNGGERTSACALTRVIQQWTICYVSTTTCLTHGGHVGYDTRDTSGEPHCLNSDLVPAKK